MSSENNQVENANDNIQPELGGKKYHRPKPKIIIGKVYADWCGHCQLLKPEWKKMKNYIRAKKGKHGILFVEIEEKQMDRKLKQLKADYGLEVTANGYPTLFKFENGKVEYYNGNRQSNALSKWVLRGGSGDNQNHIPGLMMDVQGGSRKRRVGKYSYRHNKTHYKGKYFDPNYNKYTRKNRSTKSYYKHHKNNTTKKSPGLLELFFGK
jgi:thiol-disulfide isomerase/thioredoxin